MGGAGKSRVMGAISQEEWPPQGLALDRVVFDLTQTLVYLMPDMSRSQSYLFVFFG